MTPENSEPIPDVRKKHLWEVAHGEHGLPTHCMLYETLNEIGRLEKDNADLRRELDEANEEIRQLNQQAEHWEDRVTKRDATIAAMRAVLEEVRTDDYTATTMALADKIDAALATDAGKGLLKELNGLRALYETLNKAYQVLQESRDDTEYQCNNWAAGVIKFLGRHGVLDVLNILNEAAAAHRQGQARRSDAKQ